MLRLLTTVGEMAGSMWVGSRCIGEYGGVGVGEAAVETVLQAAAVNCLPSRRRKKALVEYRVRDRNIPFVVLNHFEDPGPAAFQSGVDEGTETYLGDHPGPAGGDIPEPVADHALRQAVRLDLLLTRHPAERGDQPPVPADQPPYHPVMPEVVQPAALPVTLAGGENQGEVGRHAGLEETLLEGAGEVLGEPMPTRPPVATVSPDMTTSTASVTPMTLLRTIRGLPPLSSCARKPSAGCPAAVDRQRRPVDVGGVR